MPLDLRRAVRDPWVWGQILLVVLIGGGAPLVAPRGGPGERWLGGLALLLGVLVAAWGAVSLRENLTPSVRPLAAGTLVRAGAYARVRHPIYTGVILVLTGWSLFWSTWWVGMVVLLVTGGYFSLKASAEERHLKARFPAYDEYSRSVPKLVPRLRRQTAGES